MASRVRPADDRVPTGRVHRRIDGGVPRLGKQLTELLGARDLLFILVGRELRVRYKQTALGVAWIVLQPLVPALIFALVFGTFARLPSSGAPYFLFALSGLVIFGLFSNAVNRAGGSLIRDGALIAKTYFPRAVLPLASAFAGIVDMLVGLIVLLILMVATGHLPTLALLAIPLIAALTLLLGLGIGMPVAALSARHRDVGYVVPFVLQLLMYGSPVAYSMEILPPSLTTLAGLNPLVPLIEAFRAALLGTPMPSAAQIALGSLSGLAIIIGGLAIFSRATRDIADVI